MCDLSFWVFCIELILATVSPMEHKRDATVAGLGLSKCRDPEHYFYGLSGNWEWSLYALRIIGAITLRFL